MLGDLQPPVIPVLEAEILFWSLAAYTYVYIHINKNKSLNRHSNNNKEVMLALATHAKIGIITKKCY